MKTDASNQPAKNEATATIDQIVGRVRELYSLPAVAAEVIQLTNNPKVDARALTKCIANDPALTAKILRVVNSSLFGLSREVCDLNQALALLGTKPLKLLVLGFSLPERLFSDVTSEVLDWYWSSTLSRAVAAREISEQLFERPGDDAFLAALLQDIGVLVLLNQMQEPYSKFLTRVIQEQFDLHRIEVDSLGFDHTALSAALLDHWNMPRSLVLAISQPQEVGRLARLKTPEAELAKILHLAGLLSQLVGQNRLAALPDLLQAGGAYCELDKDRLNVLIESLQPKVRQLAEVLSVELPGGVEYADVLAEAHAQMAELAETVAEPLSKFTTTEQYRCESMLADVEELRQAVDGFLAAPLQSGDVLPANSVKQASDTIATGSVAESRSAAQTLVPTSLLHGFANKLTLAVGQCRSRRQAICLAMIEVAAEGRQEEKHARLLDQILDSACQGFDRADLIVDSPEPGRRVIVLPHCERREAVRLARAALKRIERAVRHVNQSGTPLECGMGAGVAATLLPSRNFPPLDLLQTAERCLAAASSGSVGMVKSLEIS